jgi:hypothetical protein
MTSCAWAANRLPHTAHGDCEGFLPHLAEGLQRVMDRQAMSAVGPNPDFGLPPRVDVIDAWADEADPFTTQARALVAANDRRAWRRHLRRVLRRAVERLGLAWSALVLSGVALWLLPVNVRGA